MAELFQKRVSSVTYLPGEDDVDPSLLEETKQQGEREKDYRDTNADDRANISVIGKDQTELVRWVKGGRAHVALKVAGEATILASWWDEHVQDALRRGDLDAQDLHGSAYRYAQAHQLLPRAATKAHVRAALFEPRTFVDPASPEWAPFLVKLASLPDGAEILTEDGYTLTKTGEAFVDGDICFGLHDLKDPEVLKSLPPVALKQASPGAKKHILKAGSSYLWVDHKTGAAALAPHQYQATRFASKQDAVLGKAAHGVVAATEGLDVRIVTLF